MVITTLKKPQFSLFCYSCLYIVVSLLLQIWEQTYLIQFFKWETGIKESYKFDYGLKKPVVVLVIIKIQGLIQINECVQSTLLC